jgi:cytochrome c peroxidase
LRVASTFFGVANDTLSGGHLHADAGRLSLATFHCDDRISHTRRCRFRDDRFRRRRGRRKVEITQKGPSGVDALKAQYRRPATIPFPKDNPFTPDKAALGKKLYFDTRLSVTSAQSCASCHSPGFGWGDGLAVGVGHGMAKLGRRSPTIVNAAWSAIYMWDGRLPTLEDQALGPIQSPGEMNMKLDQLMARLASIPEYKPAFDAAFPGEGMKPKTLAQAIATYERTVVSERAPFDAWVEGNEKAISEDAKRGFALFNGKAQCAACHEGWNFTNEGFQDIGLPSADVGRGEYLPAVIKMQHAFKTRSKRSSIIMTMPASTGPAVRISCVRST